MLDFSIMKPEGILVLKPQGPLSKEDIAGLSAAVDSYLSDHAMLPGVLVQTKEFPGWADFGGLAAHMRFFRDHRKKIERVAVVTDSPLANVAQSVGSRITSAEFRKFPYPEEGQALDWLTRH